MRTGRDQFETDPARRARDDRRYEEGRGLIGGDPSKRPAHVRWRPIPEPLPYSRLTGISDAKLSRLVAFLNHSPLEVEIGCGTGEFLLGRAAANPDRHFLGFEVKRHLCWGIVETAQARGLANLWISDDDARWALAQTQLRLAGRVDILHVLYPDPWWKRKHRARRLFRDPFVRLVHELLVPGGLLHVRSDVEGYVQLIEEVVAGHGGFAPHDPELLDLFEGTPPTRREAFCRSIDRPFWVRVYRKMVA